MATDTHLKYVIAVMSALAVAVLVMLVLQYSTLNVSLLGQPDGSTPGSTGPQPTPQFCHQGANSAASINERCRRLAVHQALYPNWTPDPTRTPPPPLDQAHPPIFGAADFHRLNSYSLHETRVRLPHCAAWNVTRDTTTGYAANLPNLPARTEPHEYAYFVYATPADFPDIRTFRVSGINVAGAMGAIQVQPNTLDIGAVTSAIPSPTPDPNQTPMPGGTPAPTQTTTTPIPYKYWRSAVPWSCQALGGAIVDVEP